MPEDLAPAPPRDAMPPAMAAPSLSVVIPCYNAQPWIDATLTSVLSQQWPGAMEVLVVDDGSRDRSAAQVLGWGNRVRLLRQANAGVAAARNLGIQHASGELVAFVDADDIWLPGKLMAQWQTLRANPDARLVCSAWHVWPCSQPEPDEQLVTELLNSPAHDPRWHGPHGWIYPELLLSCAVWTSTVLAQRSLLNELGGFNPTLRIGEDYDLWLRASRITPIAWVSRPLALYRMHPQSLTKGAPVINHQAQVIMQALRRWGYTSPDGRQARRSAVQAGLAITWRDYSGAHLIAGHYAQAWAGALAALRHQPLLARNWQLALQCLAARALRGHRGR